MHIGLCGRPNYSGNPGQDSRGGRDAAARADPQGRRRAGHQGQGDDGDWDAALGQNHVPPPNPS